MGGLINFPPLKRGGGLLERGGLIDLAGLSGWLALAEVTFIPVLHEKSQPGATIFI